MSFGFTLWNLEHGFVDAALRGWRSTFLTDTDYANLSEGGGRTGAAGKEDFEDMRLTLQETDYGNFLQAEVRVRALLVRALGEGWRSCAYTCVRAHAVGSSRTHWICHAGSTMCQSACARVHPPAVTHAIMQPSLDPKLIGARATSKWVKEFKYFRASATGDLAKFMDFVAYVCARMCNNARALRHCMCTAVAEVCAYSYGHLVGCCACLQVRVHD
ncbi:MAG: hypothetical protein EOO65_01140 [Methanosarcinales archaeon]|nr:MAG: hypothetical protein EOO65_01140 [Methanosarcinales archaeon]